MALCFGLGPDPCGHRRSQEQVQADSRLGRLVGCGITQVFWQAQLYLDGLHVRILRISPFPIRRTSPCRTQGHGIKALVDEGWIPAGHMMTA